MKRTLRPGISEAGIVQVQVSLLEMGDGEGRVMDWLHLAALSFLCFRIYYCHLSP